MAKKITMPSRRRVVLTAEYEPHELELMVALKTHLDGPNAAAAKNTMLTIHELKGLLPGARLLTEEEEAALASEDHVT